MTLIWAQEIKNSASCSYWALCRPTCSIRSRYWPDAGQRIAGMSYCSKTRLKYGEQILTCLLGDCEVERGQSCSGPCDSRIALHSKTVAKWELAFIGSEIFLWTIRFSSKLSDLEPVATSVVVFDVAWSAGHINHNWPGVEEIFMLPEGEPNLRIMFRVIIETLNSESWC